MKKYFLFFISISLLSACQPKQDLFTQLSPAQTGITFSNRITENDTLNILSFEYIYNGGGVALGDFNNDSLTDIYFTGNTTPNKLYLNKGNFTFEDVTAQSGVDGKQHWSSGIALVDINNDGKLDIYVCATARKSARQREKLLYVNQGNDKTGIPVFKEMACEYGIADTTHTTNAAFFDYDNDGDLDLYILTNEMDDVGFPNKYHEKIKDGSSRRTDRLYRNDYDSTLQHPVFTNVSKTTGILIEGYGLGLNICDINRDGWKDIYVTNDYLTNDLLYINNRNGTFTDKASQYFKHTSHSAMGNEVTDINNDGLPDVIAVDMMPATNYRKKMMTPANNYITYQNNDKYGYQHQYARNTLQLNQGNNPATGQPAFSEVGFLAGIAETDWSWTPMVTDFDNDGLRDIIITNGFPRDITDQDFVVYRATVANLMTKSAMTDYIPAVKIKNFAFKNQGNARFEDVTNAWGIRQPSFSNGAAYADLDNDGDLDYIVNNINDSAFVYRNNSRQQKPEESNYLRLRFAGNEKNVMGIGAIVEIKYAGQQQVYEHSPYRGYLSTVEPVAHFGLGKIQTIDELKITWQTGKTQLLKNIKAGQVLTLSEKNASFLPPPPQSNENQPLFKDVTALMHLPYKHEEADFIDFNVQKLLPHKLSQFGPGLAGGDVNGDGLQDVFIGGSRQHKGRFLIQNKAGTFDLQDLLPGKDGTEKNNEDMGVLLFDAENDGDLDLYIVSGSYEMKADSPALQDRFYLNDGTGNFRFDEMALPHFLKSGSCVKAADYDQDGDLDLFIGGRVEPGAYPKPVSSYILRNDSSPANHTVRFTDVTSQTAPALGTIGLICDALWTDFDNDGWQDLLLAGEWMPLTFLRNEKGKLTPFDLPQDLKNRKGWWNSLISGDFDNDGDMDYIAGNAGVNTLMRATDTQPFSVYASDFNKDGFYDVIPTVFFKGKDETWQEFPFNSRDDLAKQFVQTRQRFESYARFSQATIEQILKPEELKQTLVLRANYLKTSYLENKGKGVFALRELPLPAQYAPVFGMVAQDFDQDGNLDVLLTGNDYANEVSTGRMDALNGLLLKGDGKGGFSVAALPQSGYCVTGDGKALIKMITATGKMLTLTSQNQDSLRFFETKNPFRAIPLTASETMVWLTLKNGNIRKEEAGFGSSFLSQSAHLLLIDSQVVSAEIMDTKGKKRKVVF